MGRPEQRPPAQGIGEQRAEVRETERERAPPGELERACDLGRTLGRDQQNDQAEARQPGEHGGGTKRGSAEIAPTAVPPRASASAASAGRAR